MKISSKTVGPLRYALTAPDSRGLIAGLSSAFIVSLIVLATYNPPGFNLTSAVAVVSGGLLTMLVRSGMSAYEVLVKKNIQIAASVWVSKGRTPEEIRERKCLLSTMGAEAVVSYPSFEPLSSMPRVNIDGTPLMPGHYVDIKGHTLGFTGDSYSMDNVTGMAMDAATAYQEPIGMSVSHDIHNNSFESVSSGSSMGSSGSFMD